MKTNTKKPLGLSLVVALGAGLAACNRGHRMKRTALLTLTTLLLAWLPALCVLGIFGSSFAG